MKNIFFKDHDETLPLLKTLSETKDYVLINVNAHSDMFLPQDYGRFGRPPRMEDFILHSVKEKYFSKILWIKDDKSNDFKDGFYEFNIFWDDESSSLKCDLAKPYYFLGDDYLKQDASEPSFFSPEIKDLIKVQFEVISEKNLSKSKFAGMHWVLSLDCDFFSAANPFKSEHEKRTSEISTDKISTLIGSVFDIENYDEWNKFKKELIISKEWVPINKIIKLAFIETNYDENEIENKVLNILRFLKNNFAKEKCLSVFTCFSFFNGYARREKCPQIVSIIDAVFNNFDFFWEKA